MRTLRTKIARMLHTARVVVFDFDGTLVDSNRIKREAFEICFREFPQHLDEIRAYCNGNHHTPRWGKFQHVYEQILRLPYTPIVEARLMARYAAATTSQVINAPEIPGATHFLRIVAADHITALLTTTPHKILMDILDKRGWQRYFQVIQGAPLNKVTCLTVMQRTYHLRGRELMFFGDTLEDAAAARTASCLFIAVANASLALHSEAFIRDFTEIGTHVHPPGKAISSSR